MASYKIINMKKIQYSKRHKFSRTSSVADIDTDFDFAGEDKLGLICQVTEQSSVKVISVILNYSISSIK